jgi:hypothetical protein
MTVSDRTRHTEREWSVTVSDRTRHTETRGKVVSDEQLVNYIHTSSDDC